MVSLQFLPCNNMNRPDSHVILCGICALPVIIFPGCSLIRVGPAVEILVVDMDENADKNLDAIRAMQADRYRHSPVIVPAESASSSHTTLSSNEPEAAAVAPDSPIHLVPTTPSPKADALAKRPLNPSAVSPSGVPERTVPAYTIPAPVGPGQTGSARCIPDGIGGQRCLRH